MINLNIDSFDLFYFSGAFVMLFISIIVLPTLVFGTIEEQGEKIKNKKVK